MKTQGWMLCSLVSSVFWDSVFCSPSIVLSKGPSDIVVEPNTVLQRLCGVLMSDDWYINMLQWMQRKDGRDKPVSWPVTGLTTGLNMELRDYDHNSELYCLAQLHYSHQSSILDVRSQPIRVQIKGQERSNLKKNESESESLYLKSVNSKLSKEIIITGNMKVILLVAAFAFNGVVALTASLILYKKCCRKLPQTQEKGPKDHVYSYVTVKKTSKKQGRALPTAIYAPPPLPPPRKGPKDHVYSYVTVKKTSKKQGRALPTAIYAPPPLPPPRKGPKDHVYSYVTVKKTSKKQGRALPTAIYAPPPLPPPRKGPKDHVYSYVTVKKTSKKQGRALPTAIYAPPPLPPPRKVDCEYSYATNY